MLESRKDRRKGKVEPRPFIDKELVDWLMDKYPEVIPEANQSRDSIMLYSGKRSLVKELYRYAYESDK